MVGVPGKYKGCETCRRRRVKCSNERPFCQKCISSGRQCEGYEREMVFITGTPENKGRVASHPRKAGSPSKSEASFQTPSPKSSQSSPQRRKRAVKDKVKLVPLPPLTSAWDDYIEVSNQGNECSILNAALHTHLPSVSQQKSVEDESPGFNISLPPYSPKNISSANVMSETQPIQGPPGSSSYQVPAGDEEFSTSAQYLAHLPEMPEGSEFAGKYCVFLYENNTPSSCGVTGPTYQATPASQNLVEALGPAHYSPFPNHHYFVRVYRPQAVCLALLSRQETFLSSTEWMTIPWREHPKSLLDQLFDIALNLPALFAATDKITPLQPSDERRAEAQSLLTRCLSLEWQFDQWLASASQSEGQPPSPWADEVVGAHSHVPFPNSYHFRNSITGIAFLYYWMAQILFHRCIETLHQVIFEPVVDAYPDMWPVLPQHLQIDIMQYQQSWLFAANICRGLDSVLEATTQPDMVIAPMTVAADYYRELSSMSQNGMMETLWLENFRVRLMQKGQEMSDVLQRHRWVEIGTF